VASPRKELFPAVCYLIRFGPLCDADVSCSLSRAAEQLSSTECFLIAYTIGAGTSITLGAVLLAIIAAFRGARARRQRAVQLPAYEAVPTVVVDEKPSVA
jgi:hypothetical protein